MYGVYIGQNAPRSQLIRSSIQVCTAGICPHPENRVLESQLLVSGFLFPFFDYRKVGSYKYLGMDDSSMFFQWAMEALRQENPPAAVTYAVLQELRPAELQNGTAPAEEAAQAEHQGRATDSWSSGDGLPGSSNYPPVSWNLTSTMAQPSTHGKATPTAPARAPDVPEPCVESHVMAERKRREKINRCFIELSTVIPGLKKMDKATILSDAVRHVKEQQEKLKELEGRNSVVLAKRPSIATKQGDATTTRSSLPEIEARISEGNVMVRIHCEDGKGVLVRLLAEVEKIHLSITHTNVIPFPNSTLNITITAKVDHRFGVAPEDIVGRLDAVLRRRNRDR